MPTRPIPPSSPIHALELFTDRDDERKTVRDFLEELANSRDRPPKPVLSFYGVGGVGKSTLLLKACSDFLENAKKDLYSLGPVGTIATLDLDNERIKEDLPVPQLFWQLRNALNEAGVKTPLFDYLYLVYWADEFPGQAFTLPRHKASLLADGTEGTWDLGSALADVLVASADVASGGVIRNIRALLPHFRNLFHKSLTAKRYSTTPETWPTKTRVERMPEILADDLIDAAGSITQAICLLVDGFERIQSRQCKDDSQKALQAFMGAVVLCEECIDDGRLARDRIGFIILGREKLRWGEIYDEPHTLSPWANYVDEHCLGGLSEIDARDFLLNKAAPRFRNAGEGDVATHIERHADEILRAALEDPKAVQPSYLPYFLDLALRLIRNNRERFTPDMLGHTPKELQTRFLRYLSDEHRNALQVLALALSFDADLFEHLIRAHRITGFAPQDFARLVGDDHSYISPDATAPGHHRFHRHMQDSLIHSLTVSSEERTAAAGVIEEILEYLGKRSHFDIPANCTQAHLDTYGLAMNVVLTHGENGLLGTDRVIAWLESLDQSYDWQLAVHHRRPFHERSVVLLTRILGSDHPDTLRAMGNLALTLQAQGELAAARALQEEVLEKCRRISGEDHPDTLVAMNNLAGTLQAQGELAAARALQEQVLEKRRRISGEDHPDTLVAMGNLALTLQAQGELAEARALQEQVLEKRRRISGEDHPKTLVAMGNLAMTLHAQGELAAARALQEQVLEKRRRISGEDHPDTLVAMGNLAMTLHAQGDYAAARARQEQVLEKRRRISGEDHPDTLVAMGNQALTLQAQGELAAARALQEQVLEKCRRISGEDHPDTLVAMNNLALTLQAQGELAAARALQEQVLEKRRRISGEDHPDTLRAMNNLALTLQAQGELAAARALQEEVLEKCRRISGEDHPDTLVAMNNLALTLQAQGELAAARALQEQVLEKRRRISGEDHPDTLRAMNNLAGTLQAQGDH